MAKKTSSLTKTVDKLKSVTPKTSIDSETIAKGAAGVAIAAGVIAAGAALSNDKTRKRLGKSAKQVVSRISEVASSA